jgi:DNA (cytosine-5)-methyltransferase 1
MTNAHPRKTLKFLDLFCGAGGFSTGAMWAAERAGYEIDLTCVNHWSVAIETHKANHPKARHLCTGVDDVDPYKLFKPGELFALLAAPECTEHSYAKGGRAVNDQRRVTAWCVVRYAEALMPEIILVENVVQFMKWGPLGANGKPLKSRKGEIYRAWKSALIALGYKVEERKMKCDRYGVPTSRERLIVQCVRGKRRIVWPEETHAPLDLIESMQAARGLVSYKIRPTVPARDIIDWSVQGRWLDEMPGKKQYGGLPLSPNTLKRIWAGFEQYGMKPFIVPHWGERATQRPRTHSIERPVPAVTGQGAGSLVEPFVISIDHTGGKGACAWPVHQPVTTITRKTRHCVVEPFVVELRGTRPSQLESCSRSVNDPLGAVTAGGLHAALLEPFVVQCTHGDGRDPEGARRRTRSLDDVLPTLCGRGDLALCEPQILPQHAGGAMRTVEEPMPTIGATSRGIGLLEPFIIKFYGSGGSASIHDPLPTCTGNDRFALLCPEVEMSDGTRRRIRFRFRMFQPHELQLAQGFPSSYRFAGTKSDHTMQVGNALPPQVPDAILTAHFRLERRSRA